MPRSGLKRPSARSVRGPASCKAVNLFCSMYIIVVHCVPGYAGGAAVAADGADTAAGAGASGFTYLGAGFTISSSWKPVHGVPPRPTGTARSGVSPCVLPVQVFGSLRTLELGDGPALLDADHVADRGNGLLVVHEVVRRLAKDLRPPFIRPEAPSGRYSLLGPRGSVTSA